MKLQVFMVLDKYLINIVRATFKGLEALRTIEDVAKLRGKDKSEIL